MNRQQARTRTSSRARVHFKIGKHPFGIYTWKRENKKGIVFRVGPLGHLQFQVFRYVIVGHSRDARRKRHGVAVHWWGVRGRRRKMGVEISVFL